ncbi:MAG: hypothetical protein ABJC13_23985 [Acidobacteriota bacterium]
MIDMESRLASAARAWIDAGTHALSEHPEAATWLRYGAGELPPEQVETLRDHLVTCRACRQLVLAGPKAGETLVPESQAARVADAEERRAWHELRARFDEAPPAPVLVPAVLMPPPRSGKNWLGWASPLVAVLSLSIAGWTWYQANQPRLGVVIAEAVATGGSRGAERGIDGGEGHPLALLVPMTDLTAGTPVRVEFLDGTGAVVWQGEAPATEDGEYGIEIPARFRRLPGGRLRCSVPAGAWNAGGWKEVGTFGVGSPAVGSGESSAP